MDSKDYFSFTKQERRGILFFMISVTLIVFLNQIWPHKSVLTPEILNDYYFNPDSNDISDIYPTDTSDMDLWDDSSSKSKSSSKELFVFDPNNIGLDSLLRLGFSKYGAKNLINYRSKGGVIYNSEKFKSIYGIDSQIVNELQSLILYPTKKMFTDYKNETKFNALKSPEEKIVVKIELNSADSSQILKVKGIGAYTTSKILNFRKKTGGYLYIEQLLELKILNDSLYQMLASQLEVNPNLIQKININTADYKTFTTHPYFSSETANAILKYRKQHGNFADPKHISRIRSLKEEIGIKLIPYLSID